MAEENLKSALPKRLPRMIFSCESNAVHRREGLKPHHSYRISTIQGHE
jgi:hypothetical protein